MKKRVFSFIIISALTLALIPAAVITGTAVQTMSDIDFEVGRGGFTGRGNANVALSTEQARSGNRSLLVTGRTSGWHGPELRVEDYAEAGTAYEISVWVRLKTPDSANLVLSTQIGTEAPQYRNISRVSATDSAWVQLAGTQSFSAADIATGYITIYVESSSSTAEFYIDDVSFTPVGRGTTVRSNAISSFEGFDYEFWSQNRDDGGVMTLTGGGTFTAEWTDTENILFRMGKRWGKSNTDSYKAYGNITIEYEATHSIDKGHVSYLCIYGWTRNPLIEFYVVENRGTYNPGGAGVKKGEATIDGSIYDIYEATRTNMPSIDGTRTFQQYFSVRRDMRTEGTISLHEHFKAWEELGMDTSGGLYEVMLCVEGYRTSGSAEITKHVLTIGNEVLGDEVSVTPSPPPPPPPPTPQPPPPPPPNTSGFEIEDALNILRSEAGLLTLTAEQNEKYDLNKDDKVDINDAILVLKMIAGLL